MGREGWVGLCVGGPARECASSKRQGRGGGVQRVQLQPEDEVGGDVRLQAHAKNASAIVLAMRLLGRSAGVSRTSFWQEQLDSTAHQNVHAP